MEKIKELKEIVQDIYHKMDIEDVNKALLKIEQIQKDFDTIKNDNDYIKAENRRYKKAMNIIKQKSMKF